jgi:hypothetical protein
MAECQESMESGLARNLVPALTVAAIAGIAITCFFIARKGRSADRPLAVDKVVNLCQSAADKLEAFAAQALAG